AAVTGGSPELPPLPIQYADYAVWQREVLSGDQLTAETAWWREKLMGAPDAISLPFDRPRPKVMDYRGAAVPVHVPGDVSAALKDLASGEGATLFMALQAIFALLLSRLGAGEDVVIGTATAGRPRPELEGLAGFFADTVALRHKVDGGKSVRAHLGATRRVVLDAFAHQQVPFETVVEAVAPMRSMGHAPVVQVILVLQNTPESAEALDLPQVTARPLDLDGGAAQFDLALNLTETSKGLTGHLSYSSQLFDKEMAERLGAMFERLINTAVASPDAAVANLDLLDDAERHQVVAAFNDTAAEFAHAVTVADLFCAQASARPDAVAVVDGRRTLSHGALDAASNRLARHLLKLGVGPEVVVGVCLERSMDLVITLLAIWKAGGAYTPLDPGDPPQRLAFMLDDAKALLVLATSKSGANLTKTSSRPSVLDLNAEETRSALRSIRGTPLSNADRPHRSTPQNLAYVIYTSGSTGAPKGVAVQQAAVLNFLNWTQDYLALSSGDVILLKTSYTFDVSVWELFGFIVSEATVCCITENARLDPTNLFAQLSKDRITYCHFAPSAFVGFLNTVERLGTSLTALRHIAVSGEAFPTAAKERLSKITLTRSIEISNFYGPTEAAVHVTFQRVAGTGAAVPIGKPADNTQIYILDGRLEPVPVGVTGELFIGGAQVSRGYVGRPGPTASGFVADPFLGEAGARLYRTGDLARWRPDGTLDFLGRADTQTNIRGMRVELGEIETALVACNEISQATVIAKTDDSSDTRTVAYLVLEPPCEDADAPSTQVVGGWEQVFSSAYAGTAQSRNSVDFSGWVSSYTGEPYDLQTMLEWRNNTLTALKRLPHRRVLEIGCGTGLIMTGLAPTSERYVASDLSAVAVSKCEKLRASNDDLSYVELYQFAAHDLEASVIGDFDLIVINSVSQYFPNENYLEKVLLDCIRVLSENGCLFVGDVRDLRTLQYFHADAAFFNKGRPLDARQLDRSVASEKELVINPAWFEQFADKNEAVAVMSLSPRKDRRLSEMSMFRYDAILSRQPTRPYPLDVEWPIVSSWDQCSRGKLANAIHNQPKSTICVRSVRDDRLSRPITQFDAALTSPDTVTVQQPKHQPMPTLSDLQDLAAELHREIIVELSSKPGIVSIAFLPEGCRQSPGKIRSRLPPGSKALCNDPSLLVAIAPQTIEVIKEQVARRLPDHMVPAAFVGLDRIPTTSAGKVDYSSLPDVEALVAHAPYTAPEGPLEKLVASAFCELLGLEFVGRQDDFFVLGGHSLMAARLSATLEQQTGRALKIYTIFEASTVAAIAKALASETTWNE
ncbi:MAG: amino acid adenylation domain-containing protein, partial [Pseudomonadota bacterium]